MVDTPVFDGAALGAGATIAGPAIIEQPGTTVVLLDGQKASLDDFGHLHVTAAVACEQETNNA
jgi:N-methylhydantoinase A